MSLFENIQPGLPAMERLNRLEEFTSNPVDPRVSIFAKFLADRIGPGDIVPMGFMMATSLALYDLQTGVNGFTGEALRTGLENQPPFVYTLLELNIPEMAEAAFPTPFADEVKEQFQRYLSQADKEFDEIVPQPIGTVEQAQTLIIDGALKRVMALDWEGIGMEDKEEISKHFILISALILRQAGMNFQLNILRNNDPDENRILEDTDPERKKHLAGEFWLSLLSRPIPVEQATLMRDWLYMKTPEFIAKVVGKIDPEVAIRHFLETNPRFPEAARRAIYFTNDRPTSS